MLVGNMMEESKNYYTLMVNNPSATVEEQIESLEYDLVDLLASAGGNLGLLLGFSCLSVLFSFINFTANLFYKINKNLVFYWLLIKTINYEILHRISLLVGLSK